MEDDVVFELKIRLSGLRYDEARTMRDMLRNPEDVSMLAIINEMKTLAKEVAPNSKVDSFTHWAEWRPARGRRR